MKNYFKRLKTHPGLGFATMLTILMFLAAASNKSVDSVLGVLILGGIGSLLVWSIVLISNINR